jgi:hypothetical protein
MKTTKNINKYAISAVFITLAVLPTVAPSASAESLGSLVKIGSFDSRSGIGGAEISAFDPASRRLFTTNGVAKRIDIVDISKPRNPKKVGAIKLAGLSVTEIQSVAVQNGIVAIATTVGAKTDPGRIFFADVQGNLFKQTSQIGVMVGSLPDSIHFSPDGQFVVTANEGEPSSYCKTDGLLPESTDPKGSISIIDMTKPRLAAVTLDFTAFNERATALTYAGARIFGPGATVAQDLEPEFVAITDDSKYAYVTLQENNGVAVVDLVTKSIIAINGFGFKDYSKIGAGIDASDKDGGVKIANYSAFGMYQPDSIAALTTGGSTYLFTANEGDAREYPCLMGGTSITTLESEDVRFGKNADSTVDSTTKTDSQLGRLKVTSFSPASVSGAPITTKTLVSTAYSFGARSISVWAASNLEGVFPMKQLWDSGQFIEAYTSAAHPATFNADWNTTTAVINSMDSRSGSKGPEPEGLALGTAFGRKWLVVGLERDGGLMLFDVTRPTAPVFQHYINSSIPTGKLNPSSAGDVAPEGLLFISAKDSPNGKPLVISSYELSGTIGIYTVVGPN